jgi:hypothetical protein
MKYIFLDIDGVLNTESDWKHMYSLNQDCIKAFANAVKKCGEVRIVLSSTWRTGFAYNRECLPHIKNLQQQLQKYELSIYGKTPMLPSGNREDEILEYIDMYEVKQYVIIDDDASLFSKDCKQLLQIDARKGFTEKNGKQMKRQIMS